MRQQDFPDKPVDGEVLEDGHGNVWRNWCYFCRKPTLVIVRPGVVRCKRCGQ